MKCNHCGEETADDSVFCEHCGKKIGVPSTSISKVVEKGEVDKKYGIYLGLVIAYIVVVLILMIGGGGVPYLVSIVGAFMLLGAIWQKHVSFKNRPFEVATPNGERPKVLRLVFGIGQAFVGNYRETDGTYVVYSFVFLLFPLFPTGCYRVKKGKSGLNSIEWTIFGSEKSNSSEILNIYLLYYGLLIMVLFGIFGILFSL